MNRCSLLIARRSLLPLILGVGACSTYTACAPTVSKAGAPAASPQTTGHFSRDIVVGEFEGAAWEGWGAQGDAFGSGPALGRRVAQLDIRGHHGVGAASSELAGDK